MTIIETKIGAAEILWGADNPRNLGKTLEGASFFYEAAYEEQTAHETGSTPWRTFVVGRRAWVEVELLQPTLENLMLAIADGVLREEQQNPANTALDISPYAGNLLAADRMVLHPLGAAGSEDDIVIWKALVVPKTNLLYRAEENRLLPVTFQALIDEDNAGRLRLARIGDRLITPTAW